MTLKRINLALQGGGAHGAFTWGVLDRLLDEEEIEIAAISGTSAGALNGAAYKSGWLKGGREGARANLDWLWSRMGALQETPVTRWLTEFSPATAAVSAALENSLAYGMADTISRMTSPYALGPFYTNPLTQIAEAFDYDTVCASDGPRLFVGATNVRTGKIRVFSGHDISTGALLASACLPTLFQAVEIEDPATGRLEAYWDGGYSGNPALFPLFEPDLPADIMIVNINPIIRDDLPRSPNQIQNRINEISFNASLLRELRAVAFVKRLLAQGALTPGTMKDVLVHMVSDDALMNDLSVATKIMPNPVLLSRLKAAGRLAADGFLAAHRDDLNQRATVDLAAMLA
ncbi:MAG: patatin-like phospholipase family protein [Paracoccaceae bacterium]|jgi:NTE family protein|nr:patatin-like phospholipase family protein [Paracoccaceae bacterium]